MRWFLEEDKRFFYRVAGVLVDGEYVHKEPDLDVLLSTEEDDSQDDRKQLPTMDYSYQSAAVVAPIVM